MVLKIQINEYNVSQIIDILDDDGVVAIMTDTVYGLAVRAGSVRAMAKIFEIKHRDREKKLPVLVKDTKTALSLIKINPKFMKIVEQFWPGPLTVIGADLNNESETLATRVPGESDVALLLKYYNEPLAVTSANISGEITLTDYNQIDQVFGAKIGCICLYDGGNNANNKASTIIDLTQDKFQIVREGIITWQDITSYC